MNAENLAEKQKAANVTKMRLNQMKNSLQKNKSVSFRYFVKNIASQNYDIDRNNMNVFSNRVSQLIPVYEKITGSKLKVEKLSNGKLKITKKCPSKIPTAMGSMVAGASIASALFYFFAL